MAENRRHDRHVYAFLEQCGCQTVPEIVEPRRLRETRFRHEPLRRMRERVWVERRTVSPLT